MRGFRLFVSFALLAAGIMAFNTAALAARPAETNIRLGFGVWDTPESKLGITVRHTDLGANERSTDVEISGLSGAIAFSHMIGRRFAWELSMGGFSSSKTQVLSKEVDGRYRGDYYETIYSNTHSVSVSYITMGLIYYPLYELKDMFGGLSTFFRPYLTAGIGPYFGWDARWDGDSVTDANFASAMGAYPGVGLDLLLSRHFIFNIDLRYHLVEFGEPLKGEKDYSGLNAVGGFRIAF
jgi:outer membrane protein W